MGQRASSSAAEQSAGVPGRRGTCRLCFEEGTGELIAPCLCRGTSKWIHRDCLNHWRVSGSNPRALTNCCECGFQYRLKLKRSEGLSSEGEIRRRQLMRRLASQTVMWFVGLQLVICALGCIIRAIDRHEGLVRFFGFSQVKGHEGPGTFMEALKYHKITYYVSGVLLLLGITGFIVCLALLVACCTGRGSSRQLLGQPLQGPQPHGEHRIRDCGDVACACCCECLCPRYRTPWDYYFHMRMCEDCSQCCMVCCDECGRNCGDIHRNVSNRGNTNCNDCGNNFLTVVIVMVAIVVIIFIVVGLFAAIMALVTAMQKAGQEYAKIQQLRVMATEYEVQDLADPQDLGDAAPEAAAPSPPEGLRAQQAMAPTGHHVSPSAPAHTEEDLRTQAQIEQELAEMFGGSARMASEQALRGYGAA